MLNWPLLQQAFGKLNSKYVYIKEEELRAYSSKEMRKFKFPEVFTAYPTSKKRELLISYGAEELIIDGRPTFVDLFSGCGGFSLGMIKAGFRCLASVEIDKSAHLTFCCNIPVEQEAPFHCYGDITKLRGQEILDNLSMERGDLDCVVGSPPCQSFSMAGKREIGDPRDNLLFEYSRLVKELQPKNFVMENVPGIRSKKLPDGRKALDAFLEEFKGSV